MLSGRSALQSINLTLQQLRQQIDESDTQIGRLSDTLIGLQQQQARRYQDLARIRLDHIISDETVTGLQTAVQRVMELLQRREEALSELTADIERLRDEQEQKARHEWQQQAHQAEG